MSGGVSLFIKNIVILLYLQKYIFSRPHLEDDTHDWQAALIGDSQRRCCKSVLFTNFILLFWIKNRYI